MSKLGLYDYMVEIGADDERLEQVSGLLEACKLARERIKTPKTTFNEQSALKVLDEAIAKAEGK